MLALLLTCIMGISAQESTTPSIWWGNYTDQTQVITGNYQLGTYEAATFVNGSGDLKGSKINSVRFRSRIFSYTATNVKVWVRSKLDGENLAEANVTTLGGNATTWSEGTFDKPVELPETGAYVGYSFTISGMDDYEYYGTPVIYVRKVVDGGFYLKQPGETTFTDKSATGCVAEQINISGDDITANAASINDNLDDILTVVGDTINVTPTFRNFGAEGVKSIDYTYDVDGISRDGHVDFANPIANIYQAEGTASLKLAPSTKAGSQEVTIAITKVNGVDNGHKSTRRYPNEATVNLNVLSESAPRTSLVEVYVDKDKYNSGRGYVGVENIIDSLGSSVIPLTIHMSDDYAVPSYKERASDNKYYNAPIAEVNRKFTTDPYYGANNHSPYHYNGDLIKESVNDLSEAGVEITDAKWTSEAKDSVTFKVNTTFKMSIDRGATYRLGYAVIQDSIKTPQNNLLTYYKSSYPDDDMAFFREMKYQGDSVVNLNLVVASSDANGVSGSVPRRDIVAGTPLTYEGGLKVPASAEARNTRVVVFLVNSTTKDVINAAVAPVPDTQTTGINNIHTVTPTNNGDNAIYNIAGQKVSESYKGIVIKNGKKYFQK